MRQLNVMTNIAGRPENYHSQSLHSQAYSSSLFVKKSDPLRPAEMLALSYRHERTGEGGTFRRCPIIKNSLLVIPFPFVFPYETDAKLENHTVVRQSEATTYRIEVVMEME
ncbi:MAG: hypothetical protein JWR68_2595 [Polaromonas sp.]|nr:hypothetical protein [Polaromonas sp.]